MLLPDLQESHMVCRKSFPRHRVGECFCVLETDRRTLPSLRREGVSRIADQDDSSASACPSIERWDLEKPGVFQ